MLSAVEHVCKDKTGQPTFDADQRLSRQWHPLASTEIHISNQEHVQPMVQAGKSNAEMLGVKFNA